MVKIKMAKGFDEYHNTTRRRLNEIRTDVDDLYGVARHGEQEYAECTSRESWRYFSSDGER